MFNWIENHEAISAFGPLLIGFVGLVGLPFLVVRTVATYRQAKAALQQTEAIFRQVTVAEQGHITDRFTKAVEQLGSDNLAVRLGGIYALERIAKDSERDHWTIMEVLTAYVRENAPWLSKSKSETDKEKQEDQSRELSADIQAILTVIGRRTTKFELQNQQIDLSNTDLRRIKLIKANFDQANFKGSRLDSAKLPYARFNKTNLEFVVFNGADLTGVEFKNCVSLEKAKFNKNEDFTWLKNAHFEGVSLSRAEFKMAWLKNTRFNRVILSHTSFENASFDNTDFMGTSVVDEDKGICADFSGTKIDNTKGIKNEDIEHIKLSIQHRLKDQEAVFEKAFPGLPSSF